MKAPIGVLDSGLGGLSVLEALRARLPYEDFLYCADCGHAPWGDKTQTYIQERCRAIVGFMLEHHAKAIVIACNTATAMAADDLRSYVPVPVIGIEPAVKPAVKDSARHCVGVLATTRTITSPRYASLLSRFAGSSHVISQAAPGLMECVEAGDFDTPSTRALIHKYLDPMLEAGIDTLVLGCTHYPFLRDAIKECAGNHPLTIIEPGPAVAAVCADRLAERQALAAPDTLGREVFYVSNHSRHAPVLARLWPRAQIKKGAELPV